MILHIAKNDNSEISYKFTASTDEYTRLIEVDDGSSHPEWLAITSPCRWKTIVAMYPEFTDKAPTFTTPTRISYEQMLLAQKEALK